MNPYKVLGVNENSTQEQIRAAYLNLAKKYHPDKYTDPAMKELATEKIKEINNAYEVLKNGGRPRYQTASDSNGDTREFADIEFLINRGMYSEAISELGRSNNRNARWHYLYGTALHNLGNYDASYSYFETAVRMEPNNLEYRRAFENARGSGYRYSPGYSQYSRGRGDRDNSCGACDICSALICADCCCECMGGDLISCC